MLEKRKFYINGEWVEPKNSKDIQVINPATEKSCAVISLGGKEDVEDAVSAAKTAFQTWGFTKKEVRIKLLEKLPFSRNRIINKFNNMYSLPNLGGGNTNNFNNLNHSEVLGLLGHAWQEKNQ